MDTTTKGSQAFVSLVGWRTLCEHELEGSPAVLFVEILVTDERWIPDDRVKGGLTRGVADPLEELTIHDRRDRVRTSCDLGCLFSNQLYSDDSTRLIKVTLCRDYYRTITCAWLQNLRVAGLDRPSRQEVRDCRWRVVAAAELPFSVRFCHLQDERPSCRRPEGLSRSAAP